MIPIFVGVDDREVVGYHVFCHSVLARTKARVAFHPVRGTKVEGSTTFNPERFGIAREMGYRGWAIWAECDQLMLADVEELMQYADPYCGVVVAKHQYTTRHPTKFLGQPNPDYERKNWSSFMLVNARNAAWERLETGYNDTTGQQYTLADLHRFRFMDDVRIGSLPLEWNHLVSEYEPNPAAKLAHFTIGLPCWPEYADCEYADAWRKERNAMLGYEGHDQGRVTINMNGEPFNAVGLRAILKEINDGLPSGPA